MAAKKTTTRARSSRPANSVVAELTKPTASPLTWALAITFSVLSIVFVGQVLYYYT